MLFSYAVRAVYIESCSMFVRGGVYKVVHEAMGGTGEVLGLGAAVRLRTDRAHQRASRRPLPGRDAQRDGGVFATPTCTSIPSISPPASLSR